MFIQNLTVGALQCNCSILACEKTREAIVIDPGDEAEKIEKILKAQDFKLKYLIHTHAHFDHFGATEPLRRKLGGQTCLHEEDLFLFENAAVQTALFGLPAPETGKMDFFVSDKDILKFGGYQIEVFHTPGHSPGSICFYIEDGKDRRLFSGDTLFYGSVGRTDLWGGDARTLTRSIQEKLYRLEDETRVIAGHGPETTIGREKKMNPFVKVK